MSFGLFFLGFSLGGIVGLFVGYRYGILVGYKIKKLQK